MRTLIAIFILTLSVMAMAQTVTSGIVGNVRDSSGAAITNARVVVVNTATNARSSAQTGANGSYVLLQLNPGVYRLEVEANGFRQYVQTGIVLDIGQEARQDVALQVGQVSNTVTVQADATTLDTTTSTLGDVVNNKAILNLPLNTRNPFSLIALVPGYSGSIDNNYNGVAFSINGGRTDYGEIFVDGVPAGFPTVGGNAGVGVFPSVDAIGEFKVLAQNYPAEFGHSADGVVSVVYKSGTNQFHGTAFEFLRNSALDANNYFSDAQGLPLPSFKQSQFGGILTGPVRKDKTFFLLSTELLRQGSFASVTTTVPTLLQRQGDFSQTYAQNGKLITIYNPFSTRPNPSGPGFIRNPFPENKIPSTMLNPVALNVLKYFPLPNTTGNSVTNANNYYATGKTSNNINSWDIRIDHTLSSTQKISARYSDRFADSLPQPLFPAAQAVAEGQVETTDHMRNLDFAYTYIPSSKTILDARLGFARALYDYIPTNGSLGFLASSLGLPAALDTIDGVSMFPQFTQTGYATLGAASYDHNAFMTYSLLASLTKVYGSHTVKLGVDARMIRIDDHEADHPTGTYGFTTAYTQGPNPAAAGSNTGNGLASLLLGTGSGSAIQNYQNLATQSFYFAEYLQDDWMITPRLTLNAGIRYDLSTPRTERFNRMNYLDLNAPSPLAPEVGIPGLKGGLQFVGVDGHGRHQYDWETNNVAPRLGLSYRLDDKTVVHAAAGIVYAQSPQAAAGTIGTYGFSVTNSWVGSLDGFTPYDTLSNPFPQGFQPIPGASQGLLTAVGGPVNGELPHSVTPYVVQYNLNFQRSLGQDTTFEIGYAGNRTHKLDLSYNAGINLDQLPTSDLSLGSQLNQLVPNPFYGFVKSGSLAAPTISRMQLLRPYPQFTSVVPINLDDGTAEFDSLQVRFNRRFTNGLQVMASYVWSKNMDDGDSHQDSYNPKADWAVTSWDFPQRFVASYIYELPIGRGHRFGSNISRPLDAVLGGWQINGVTTLQSGKALAISASNTAGIGTVVERANTNGKYPALHGSIRSRLNRYFDTTAFSQPAAYTLGNTPAYISYLRAPGTVNTDLSIFKQFSPVEGFLVQFRAEAFNAFNYVQFGSPNVSVTSTSFGEITSQANSPRQIQFGLKLLF